MNTKNGVILLCLVVLLSACKSSPEIIRVPVTKTVIEKVTVPAELLEPCREPDLGSLVTTGDLERVAGEAIASLSSCNTDKVRIREWQETD